mgnify:CR=1 FL=1|tara:strand:+ start:3054 stop:4367 length:1314 start_codon:yes stop_codon:yes gene_type:complete
MDHEGKFLHRAIEHEELVKAFSFGFKSDLIVRKEYKDGIDWVVQHFNEYGKPPSLDRFKSKYPHLKLSKTEDSIEEVVSDLRVKYTYQSTLDLVKKAGLALRNGNQSNVDNVSQNAYDLIRSFVYETESVTSRSTDVELNSEEFKDSYIKRYEEKKSKDGVFGVCSPWPTLNNHTQGAQDGDLFTIVARTKVGKTFTLGKWCSHVWYHEKKNTLLISNELTTEAMTDRLVSYISCVPYGDLRSATLSYFQYKNLVEALEDMSKENTPFIVSGNDDNMGGYGVAGVEAKIIKYKPDIVFIDGAYLMDDDLNARDKYIRAGNIARGIKKLAKRQRVPIIITWQLSRKGKGQDADTSTIGLTDDLGQDSSLILALYQTEDMKLSKRMLLRSMAGRECPSFEFEICWDFESMNFDEIEEVTTDDNGSVVDNKDTIEFGPEF